MLRMPHNNLKIRIAGDQILGPPPGHPRSPAIIWFEPGAFSNKTIAYVLQKIGNAQRELLNTPSFNG